MRVFFVLAALIAVVKGQVAIPSALPTTAPTTAAPTTATPTTATPTLAPTAPTSTPTEHPTAPTVEPTVSPTAAPTAPPTHEPSASPTQEPSSGPSEQPTASPTSAPTLSPTKSPTEAPTQSPTPAPSSAPTVSPSPAPSTTPTSEPTTTPVPTYLPGTPTPVPTPTPTASPIPPTPQPTIHEISLLPMFWFGLGITSSVLSAAAVVYRWLYPNRFRPFFEPIYGVRERLAGAASLPLCPPSFFTAFLSFQCITLTFLIVGCLWVTGSSTDLSQYCFVGVMLLGLSLVMVVTSASALFEVGNCRQIFCAGVYIVFTSAYIVFGSKTHDGAALGCGVSMLVMVPAFVAVHVLREPGLAGGMAGVLLAGEEHPYKDLKTQHGSGGQGQQTTSV